MIDDPFHQSVSVFIDFDKTYSSGQLNRKLKELGATLYYDVYSFKRKDKGPIWQSESLIYVVTFYDDKEVDAQDSSNRLELKYPLATLGADQITMFAKVAGNVADSFGVKPLLDGLEVTEGEIIQHCEDLVTDLMEQWGEEPGSKTLRIFIESQYR
ncbi:hypothetical protein OA92_13410 [Marinomonas sp. SBI22]|uniref:hypothetical protein n=1 Tax=unclassified Marinomonas TaxID=196814 RepID=UPI0007AF14D1|nr:MULTISPECIES: hypothetical protein [unclassified Marinomonas]KZM42190.1 hypothetical protein OA92_13410 [Marinomonas sp. SBI22]KZM47309.1 hypothetical protein OA91_02110 [Marinomonas sp. SBI8L]